MIDRGDGIEKSRGRSMVGASQREMGAKDAGINRVEKAPCRQRYVSLQIVAAYFLRDGDLTRVIPTLTGCFCWKGCPYVRPFMIGTLSKSANPSPCAAFVGNKTSREL